MDKTNPMMSGARKAAVLLLQMDREDSTRVLSLLRENEVEELSTEIARLGGGVEFGAAEAVLAEAYGIARAPKHAAQGGLDFARDLLEASLGPERATDILHRLSASLTDVPFGFLSHADPRQVLSFVQNEHPQTIALVLAHMAASTASQILSGLAADLQADVAHRIAVMDRTSPEVIRQLETTLERKLSSVLQPTELSVVGGLQPLVDIINRSDRGTERLILEGLESRNPELAEEIRRKMFMFEDITHLEDRAIQLVVREVETSDLATALKGVTPEVHDKIARNLSERGRENLSEEVDLLGAVRLRMVEEAQAKIVQAIRRLESAGQIEVSRGDEDEYVN
ncbi:MAG: flagellar motor switch protein FliG [Micromonosporaceae bacterium]